MHARLPTRLRTCTAVKSGACGTGSAMAGDVPRLRVLALHGMGTNSVVLRHQLKALTAACDSLDVVYLDGREECPGEPTVAKVFASAAPFRRYMTRSQLATGPVYEHIEEAVASVEAFLRGAH